MQLYALDTSGNAIAAFLATRQSNYFCSECGGIVRVRGGLHRQEHFYHLQENRACRQNGKSAEHLHVQHHFLKNLPQGECALEQIFSSIGRIADIFWEPRKVVFEVQCSPISAREVAERNRDYRSLGLEVVWILHDVRYNKNRLSGAEFFLQESAHYFTNIDKNGSGIIYDQLSAIDRGKRVHRLPTLPIDIANPQKTDVLFKKKSYAMVPHPLFAKRKKWRICFLGDFFTLLETQNDAMFIPLKKIGIYPKTTQQMIYEFISYIFLRPYRLIFQLILERCCK